MNDIAFPELSALRIEITDEVRDEQFAAIVAALDVAAPPARVPLMTRARIAWRRWVVSIAAVGTALVPVGAIASESAVPGDTLYPIKLAVERVQVWFDSDIAAEHRVDEVERMIDRQVDPVDIDRHLATTLDTLEATDRPDLVDRYERLVTDHRPRDGVDVRPSDVPVEEDRPAEDRPSDRPPPSDRPNDEADVAPDVTTTVDPSRTTTPPTDDPPADTTTSTRPDRETTTTSEPEDVTTTTEAPRDGDDGDQGGDGG